MAHESTIRRLDEAADLRAVVAEVTQRWRAGQPADARAVVDQYPSIADHRSLLYDLVAEDFHARRVAGEALGPLTYREQFESFGVPLAESIERVIALEGVLDLDA